MASRHEIKCITKNDRLNPYERITDIGGVNADGKKWSLTQKEAIGGIKRGEWIFYVSQGGRAVNVIVSTSRFGNEYIKTEADGAEPNNLLALPSC